MKIVHEYKSIEPLESGGGRIVIGGLAGELVEGEKEELIVVIDEQRLANLVVFQQVEGSIPEVAYSQSGQVDVAGLSEMTSSPQDGQGAVFRVPARRLSKPSLVETLATQGIETDARHVVQAVSIESGESATGEWKIMAKPRHSVQHYRWRGVKAKIEPLNFSFKWRLKRFNDCSGA